MVEPKSVLTYVLHYVGVVHSSTVRKRPHKLVVGAVICGKFSNTKDFVFSIGAIEHYTEGFSVVGCRCLRYVDLLVSVIIKLNSVTCGEIEHKLPIVTTVVIPSVPKELLTKVVVVVNRSA